MRTQRAVPKPRALEFRVPNERPTATHHQCRGVCGAVISYLILSSFDVPTYRSNCIPLCVPLSAVPKTSLYDGRKNFISHRTIAAAVCDGVQLYFPGSPA